MSEPTEARAEKLLGLALRVEQAPGADRELDRLAGEAAGWRCTKVDLKAGGQIETLIAPDGGKWGAWHRMPAYTASLDAAITLVPEGWGGFVEVGFKRPVLCGLERNLVGPNCVAATPALALTAACLRALATEGE